MRIFGLKTCDTCRRALRALPGAEFVDVRAKPMSAAFWEDRLAEFGPALVNTRSATWRGLSAEERAAPPLALLQAHPALMKRPLVEAGGRFYLGWSKEVRAALGVA